MGVRGRFFAMIVVAAFAANFTVGMVNWVLWLTNPPGGNTGFWQDPNSWLHLGLDAVIALVLWVVAYRMWARVAREVTRV